jgi:hypothetical protein
MGDAARVRISDGFLGPAHLGRYMELFRGLLA